MHDVEVRSCGFLILRDDDSNGRQFLLMKHPRRWDLPKGHEDPGESQLECALRELEEETGLALDDIDILEGFRYVQHYTVCSKRTNHQPRLKELVIFGALLSGDFGIVVTEHEGYAWFDWCPPHSIQEQTIDPLLEYAEEYFAFA